MAREDADKSASASSTATCTRRSAEARYIFHLYVVRTFRSASLAGLKACTTYGPKGLHYVQARCSVRLTGGRYINQAFLERHRRTELKHPAVLQQRRLQPQRTEVGVERRARAPVEQVVDV